MSVLRLQRSFIAHIQIDILLLLYEDEDFAIPKSPVHFELRFIYPPILFSELEFTPFFFKAKLSIIRVGPPVVRVS